MGLIIDSFCGGGGASTGIEQAIHRPLGTITSKDRFGLVVVEGEQYQIVDIGMRILTPRELFRAQGFLEDYIIDRDYEGRPYSKAKQTERVGNSVCPDIARALVEVNMNAEAARMEA
ncbi:MAG: DNA cytosine methyltransferase [Peptostreptococcaceae bacterium]|nr:DNA cytosine methyltransferase [Peptostreptococcaceae bacterium]